ncbi:DotD/TraH family lipoprotein [Cronobacter dublinensis]|uniref:DotD/TraH family lipoprotein n=1 Tax=Cronobacter dublinensis TaxID=413497 RepID=UPI000CFB9089|nr:DotD/TraH family lipoprotein [Cronobacter dublinensis]
MKRIVITALSALLCSCQYSNPPITAAPHSVKQPSRPVQQQLQQLWFEGTLNTSSQLPLAAIRADSDRVSLSWNGDAIELLSALARARGQVFSYTGVRLPLPVDIEVQGVTYTNLLRMIEMQTSWRASLVTYPGQMVLQFMPLTSAGSERHIRGGGR